MGRRGHPYDQSSPGSGTTGAGLTATGAWVGKVLAEDPQLRKSLQDSLEAAARGMAPELAGTLTRHIADTVKQWDDREMSEQIELNIGSCLR